MVAVPPQAWGASFDCTKAATQIEKTICGDAEVSRLDSDLGDAYRTLRGLLDPKRLPDLKANQVEWLKLRNRTCLLTDRTRECLKETIAERLDVLAKAIARQSPADAPSPEAPSPEAPSAQAPSPEAPTPEASPRIEKPRDEPQNRSSQNRKIAVAQALERILRDQDSAAAADFETVIRDGDADQTAQAYTWASSVDIRLRLIERAVELGSKEAMFVLASAILNGEIPKYDTGYARELLRRSGIPRANATLAALDRQERARKLQADEAARQAYQEAALDSKIRRLLDTEVVISFETPAELLKTWGTCDGYLMAVLSAGLDRLEKEPTEAAIPLTSIWSKHHGGPIEYEDGLEWDKARTAADLEGRQDASRQDWLSLRTGLTICLEMANTLPLDDPNRTRARRLTREAMNIGRARFDPAWACKVAIADMLTLARKGADMCYELAEHSKYMCSQGASRNDLRSKIAICRNALMYQQ